MNTISMTAMLRTKLLLGAALLVCVAATPFGAVDRGADTARTLAFAGNLLKVSSGRWAVEGQRELAVATSPTAAVLPVARVAAPVPQGGSQGPEPTEATVGGSTVCPASHTSCPQEITVCPTVNTACPVHQTVCVATQCPANPTACPEVATTCQMTVCPAIYTSCPITATVCPRVATHCPVISTRCPQIATSCPLEFTVCNTLATHCPKDPTVCEHTVCPAQSTHCPINPTVCDFTTCNTDSESSCTGMRICMMCGISYQEGPPVGYLEPSRITGAIVVRAETTTVRAPRLSFLP